MWPVLFKIPVPFTDHAIPIQSFGLMVALAFLFGSKVMERLLRREGFTDFRGLDSVLFWILIGVVLGARALYVIVQRHEFEGRWIDAIRIDKGGMVMYGGMIGAVSLGIWRAVKEKLPLWQVADAGGVAGALGLGIGRIGCLLVGDDYGKPCDPSFPLAIKFSTRFEPGSFLGIPIPANNGNLAGDHQGLFLHPTQVYMSVNGFLLCLILLWMWRTKAFHGQVFWTFVLLKALTRSIIEVFRDDADRGTVGPLSTSQFLGLVTGLVAIGMLVFLSRRRELRTAPDRLEKITPAD